MDWILRAVSDYQCRERLAPNRRRLNVVNETLQRLHASALLLALICSNS